MPDGRELTQEFEALLSMRRQWEPEWREQAEFIRPNARRVMDFQVAGTRQTQRLFDTTAPDACRKLASFLMGAIMSASTRWFSLVTADAALMRDRDVAIWLDDVSTLMYAAFQASNFNAVFPKVYASLAAMGTAAVYMEERELKGSGFNGFRFYAVPVGKFVMDTDIEGKLSTFGREFTLSARNAVARFKEDNVPDYLKRLAEDKPHDQVTFRHILKVRNTTGSTKTQKPVASYYLEGKEREIVRESGYDEMPVFAPRWEVEEGEVYGRGPGHVALPDVRSLNVSKQLGLEALHLLIRPPLQAPHDGIAGGKPRITPAALNYLTGDGEIKPIFTGSDLKSEMIKGDELKQNIKGVFYRDLVALPDKNYMTATEIVKQLDLIHRELGPTLGQIQTDLLKPLIDRSFAVMYRANAFPPPPDVLAGQELDTEYEGPLARAQRMGDLQALQNGLAMVAGVGQFAPDAFDCIDADATTEAIWESSGADMRLLRSKTKRGEIREARAQAATQAAQIEQAQGVMDVAATGATAGKTMKEAEQVGNA